MKNTILIFALIFLFSTCKNNSSEVIPGGRVLSDITLKDYFITSIAFDKTGNAWLWLGTGEGVYILKIKKHFDYAQCDTAFNSSVTLSVAEVQLQR